jgi:hypothetical protein
MGCGSSTNEAIAISIKATLKSTGDDEKKQFHLTAMLSTA